MKTELALYHLLLDRLRVARNNVDNIYSKTWEQLEHSLKVANNNSEFEICWMLDGIEYGPIIIPKSKFSFYVQNKNTGNDQNIRLDNWKSSQEVIRMILRESKSPLSSIQLENDTSFASIQPMIGETKNDKLNFWKRASVSTTIALIVAFLISDFLSAIWVVPVLGGLFLLTSRFDESHSHQLPNFIETLIIALGGVVGASTNTVSFFVLLVVLVLISISLVETFDASCIFWFISGLTCCLPAITNFDLGIAFCIALLLMFVFYWSLVSDRLPRFSILAFIAGMTSSMFVAIIIFKPTGLMISEIVYTPYQVLNLITFFSLTVAWLTWWIHGSQFSLLPSTLFFSLSFVTGINLIIQDGEPYLVIFIGLGLVALWRVVLAFWLSRRGSTKKIEIQQI